MAIDINIPSQVKNYANLAAFPATGTLKTIFIAEDTNKTYRWTGSAYVEISASAGGASTWGSITGTLSSQTDLQNALNTKEPTITAGTSAQYYRGDKSFQTLDKNAVGLSNVDNTSDANKTVSTATQTALNAKQDTLVSGTNIKTINGNTILGSGDLVVGGSSGIAIGTTAITSGTVGRVLFEGTGNVVQESANLFWDNTNEWLGLGTTSPLGILHLKETATTTRMLMDGDAGQSKIITYRTNGLQRFGLYVNNIAESGGNAGSNFAIRAYNDAGSLLSTPLYIHRASGNVGINTTTDAGFKLDINGTARVSGQTSIAPPSVTGALATPSLDIEQTWNTTSAPNAFSVNVTDTASAGVSALMRLRLSNTTVFSIAKDGYITFGGVAGGSFIAPSTPTTGAVASVGQSINISHNITTGAGYGVWFRKNSGNRTATSGDSGQLRIFETFAPTSGTGTYNTILIDSTINQTGGANGITRGLYINPTLTAAANFRAIETSRGNVVFGNLPTSPAGLPTGAIWNNLGILSIV